MSVVNEILRVVSWAALVYFAVLSLANLTFTLVAWRRLAAHRRARRYLPLDEMDASPFTPPISMLVPAFNEEAEIVSSVDSLLDLRYPRHEVIVINDGSTDRTLEQLRAAFDLAPVRKALRTRIATAPVRASYVSRTHPNLWVLDKENGGKSDSLNVGINAATHALICVIDADAVLEQDSLLRIVKPFVDAPDLVAAAGGIVRVANGCVIDSGSLVEFRLPQNSLARFQVLEYFRVLLIGRVAFDRLNGVFIIFGAFGLFKRAIVEAVGGYARDTVGEDVDLVIRLHRYLRTRGEEYRIRFISDPVCWTEAPEDLATLSHQRRRWQRGVGEVLWRHRSQIGNPRAGALGLVVLPYVLLFEVLGSIPQFLGIPVVLVSWLLGAVSLQFFLAFLAVSVLLSVLLSIAAIMLEEYELRHEKRASDTALLVLYGLLEDFGYKQVTAFFGCRGVVDLLRRRHDWGEMRRRGLERPEEASAPRERART
jgi:cellulose synthase/poly-beta-1,6-N-acetylglucosamine synthase-like glycosyltransferase